MKGYLLLAGLLAGTGAFAQNSGNVGIGTTSPQAQLHTTGTLRFDTLRGDGVHPIYADANGMLVGQSAASTFTAVPALNIPDASCAGAVSTITVTGQPAAVPSANIQVKLNITHTWDEDLRIYLTAPNGQVLNLAYGQGGSGDNYTNTVFSDAAAFPTRSGTPPFAGAYQPDGNNAPASTLLSCTTQGTVSTFGAIGGGSIVPNGSWSLQVIDAASSDVGTLNSWSISFDGRGVPVTKGVVARGSADGMLTNSHIYDNGRIGINTLVPLAPVDILADTLGIRSGAAWDNLWLHVTPVMANINASGADSGLRFNVGTNSAGAYGNGQSLTTAMTLLPNGNAGIGTTAPAQRLEVAGTTRTTTLQVTGIRTAPNSFVKVVDTNGTLGTRKGHAGLGIQYIIALQGCYPTRGGGSGGNGSGSGGCGDLVMVGEIRLFAGNFVPSGWVACDGSLLTITQYPAVFAILGTTYGGDGQRTFALPDLRGAVPVGGLPTVPSPGNYIPWNAGERSN